jgi:ERCC4-type nuclease
MVTILMDERERRDIRAALQALPCDLIIKTLDVGDFVLSRDIGIERKRGDDFAASLVDTRLFTQAYRMKKVFPKPLIILENLAAAFRRPEIRPQSIYGAMSYLTVKLHIPILVSTGAEQTAQMIGSFAAHLQRHGIYPPHDLTELTLGTEQITRSDQRYFLQGLMDVGEHRAEQLLAHFKTPMGALRAMRESRIIYTKTGKAKGVSGPIEGVEGLGPKFLEHNAWLFEDIPDAASIAKKKHGIRGDRIPRSEAEDG